jgi:adenylylsulfate kinase
VRRASPGLVDADRPSAAVVRADIGRRLHDWALMSVVWLSGPVGAGKSTLARAVRALVHPVAAVALLDEDEVREAIAEAATDTTNSGGESGEGRLSGVARVLAQQGLVVVVAASYTDDSIRLWNHENLPGYREVYLRASPETIKHRARRRRSIDGSASPAQPAVGPAIASPSLAALPSFARAAAMGSVRPPDPDLTLDMDNPEPPELLAFRVAVLIPEFVVAAAGAAGLGAHHLRRGA